MGSHYSSFLIPKIDSEKVSSLITAWLENKGYELEKKRPVMELDDTYERGLILYSNEQWTILLYSNFEEEERLNFELEQLGKPVLHFWLYDSDVWGYELYKDGGAVSAFNSNPHYFGTYDEPEAPNDLSLLCQLCNISGREGPIRKIQQQKGFLFKESICQKFVNALNAAPAASSFRYDEWSAIHQQPGEFSVKYLRFCKKGFDPLEGFDLHETEAYAREINEKTTNEYDYSSVEALIGKAYLRRMKILGGIISFVFKFIFLLIWPFIQIRRSLNWLAGNTVKPVGAESVHGSISTVRSVNNDIINDLHGCRITLSESATTVENPNPYLIHSVFNLNVDGFQVICNAKSVKEVRQLIVNRPNTIFLSDENWFVSGLPAKSVSLIAETGTVKMFYDIHFVKTPKAIYVFNIASKEEIPSTIRNKIKTIVGSFRLDN